MQFEMELLSTGSYESNTSKGTINISYNIFAVRGLIVTAGQLTSPSLCELVC